MQEQPKWMPIAEAARLANVSNVQWLHKLKNKGDIPAYYETRGMMKYWYVDINSPRFLKLLGRSGSELTESPQPKTYQIDWDEWTSLCARGEEIVKKNCTAQTIKNYRRYAESFFRKYSELNRDTLREALKVYELKETSRRDYHWPKFHIYASLMTVAKYFVYKGYATKDLVDSIRLLKPIQKVKGVRVVWPEMENINKAASELKAHKTKRNSKVYSDYNAIMNEAIILFHRWTAARASEIAKLTLRDIDWRDSSAELDGKGGKWRPVGMPKPLVDALKAYLKVRPKDAKTDRLFISDKGVEMRGEYLSRRVKRAGKWVGATMSSHALRRASITDMLTEQGLDLATVRDIAGHVDFTTTNRYAKTTRKKVVESMKRLS